MATCVVSVWSIFLAGEANVCYRVENEIIGYVLQMKIQCKKRDEDRPAQLPLMCF